MAERRIINGYIVERRDDGSIVTVGPANAGPVTVGTPDPAFQYEGPQAQAELARTQASTRKTQVDANVTAATAPADIRLAEAQARKAEAEAAKLASGKEMTAQSRADAIRGFKASMALTDTIAALEKKYKEGPGSTSGLSGLQDYLPLEQNERFDRAANAARGTVGDVLGFTGGQLNSAQEAQMNVGPFIPQAGDKDGTILDSIQRLKDLQTQGIERSVAILGGIPDASGSVLPVPENVPLNAMTVTRVVSGRQPGAAGYGATETSDPYPPEMLAEHDAMVQRLLQEGGGRLDPNAYAQARSELNRRYGFGEADQSDRAWAGQVNEYLDEGGATVPSGIEAPTRELSGVEQFRNNLVNNPVGAGVTGFTDGVGLGVPTALASDQMAALREAQPVSTAIGQIGGTIAGTGAIGRGGAAIAGKVNPNLLGGGAKARFGRELATDVAYGAGYGGITQGDPLTSAGLAGVGSLGGQAIGKGVGAMVGGVDMSPAVQYLRNRNIPLTTGQTVGGIAQRVEDKAVSLPLVGDMIRNRRLEGLEAFNKQAFEEAGAPIGFAPQNIGKEGIEDLSEAVSRSYGDATQGVSVPFDRRTLDDLAETTRRAASLPRDHRRALGEILDYRVQPLADAGGMTGETYQQAVRGLKAARNKPPQRFEGFEDAYRDRVSETIDALDGTMMRGGGDSVVSGLQNANAANRNLRTLENAAQRGAGGSQTDQIFTFTPSQLQRAGMATNKKYPGGRPFEELADNAQQVLPSSVPNSGTADRLSQMAMPGVGAIGLGSGSGYLLGGTEGIDDGAKTGAALSLLLALGGTRKGQAAINTALVGRPEFMRTVGNQVKRRKGLFGSGGAALALSN